MTTAETTETYEREAADPDCLSPEEADALLAGAPWRRFVVLGDSVAEGLGERAPGYGPDPWAHRVATALRRQQPELTYLNLGVRELRSSQVRETQLDPALAFRPDLAAVFCGGNDLLVRHWEADRVEGHIDAIVRALRDAGSDVLTFTFFDLPKALPAPPGFGAALAERMDELAERMRLVAGRHATLHVEGAWHPAGADLGIYSSDFKHVNTRGHAICASMTIRRLAEHLGNAPGPTADQ